MPPTFSFLGPNGTYSHQAAYNRFGDSVQYVGKNTIADVYEAVCKDCPFGLIPQENSIFGTVIESYDLLRRPEAGCTLFVRDEVTLSIQHCLLVKIGTKLEDVTKILSHVQALGQCGRFIEEHLSNASLVKTSSTVAAVEAVLSDESGTSAAIASKLSVRLFDGLELLYEGIQDENSNFTRFYVVSNSLDEELPSSPTEIIPSRGLFRIHPGLNGTTPGQLPTITSLLNALQLRVNSVDRRPLLGAKTFDSLYFVEVEDDEDKSFSASWLERLNEAKASVEIAGGEVTLLGTW